MKSNSKSPAQLFRHLRGGAGFLAALVLLSVALGACMTATEEKTPEGAESSSPPGEKKIKFNHAQHVDQGMECSSCHEANADVPGHMTIAGHDVCSACHEIGEDQAAPTTCQLCHVGTDLSFERTSVLNADVKFAHDPHTTAQVACATCHEDVDKRLLPKGPLKPFCMNCHGKTSPTLNECTVCHQTITRETVPTMRGQSRIPHDSPEIWEHVHGRESRVNPEFCAMCHDQQASCQECHDRVAPKDHTVAWRTRTHGLHATWERNRCDACHTEDTCVKCHKSNAPQSHRGGWGKPLDQHCVSCHFSQNETGCMACHETIEHPSAMPSPHSFGLFPANCATCHPGGLPFRAPHLVNSTVRCVVCHQ